MKIRFGLGVLAFTVLRKSVPASSGLSSQQSDGRQVIFDRGDFHDLYGDEAVLRFAERFRVALLLHKHCPGKRLEDHNDLDMDPSKGLGRALLAALDQFATVTGHHELTHIPLIFLGFSGARPLSARLVGFTPKRVLAAVLSSPGH